jgi:hypothetical protein
MTCSLMPTVETKLHTILFATGMCRVDREDAAHGRAARDPGREPRGDQPAQGHAACLAAHGHRRYVIKYFTLACPESAQVLREKLLKYLVFCRHCHMATTVTYLWDIRSWFGNIFYG